MQKKFSALVIIPFHLACTNLLSVPISYIPRKVNDPPFKRNITNNVYIYRGKESSKMSPPHAVP